MKADVPIMACGKKLYHSWKHATYDAKEMRKKGLREEVYYCRRCQSFHVGTSLRGRYKR